ncbi:MULTISPECIES: FAD-dependent oxidoreductase [unclassified Psychrobacter]|uniref:NAD(P)/FAD-dependent oxidoreductase n=1 Tax=unclassified Psychrobacter TaxID=196806 RepID=UPI0025B5AEC8|nr:MULTISPECIES: FAD-dependent oxidoreductase [unclassified Psychrobacter]MDN3454149.1 FAD-dependent oxidoreductase [Psychrobacter sp. APC 3350]MDN3502244.1 FAD-dependent oxidoreductase [Psychrobacter sp. 5A.1]
MPFTRFKRANRQSAANNEITNSETAIDSKQTTDQKRIAIIGSGVSGLTCAHYLSAQHEVTVFEANDYIGGHVNTIDVTLQDGKKAKTGNVETSAIDTGFIVFNERTYPNFFRLLYDLKVPFQSTDMSFSVKNIARHFEYNGHTLNTLLSQRKNVLNPKFWRFIKDILQFNKHIKQLRQDYEMARAQGQDVSTFTEQTLGNYLTQKNYGKLFTDNYLLPMVSAIWSTSLDEVQDFPLVFFAQFFDNHGLLDVVNRPQWFTIKGGSKQYVNKLVPRFIKAGGKIRVNSPVQSVVRDGEQVLLTVQDKGNADNTLENLVFDEVIFACHADTALKILKDASTEESELLGHFRFTKNTAVLHTDTSVLPKKPLAWASWNYLIDETASGSTTEIEQAVESAQTPAKPVLTYHMNILQRLTKQHNYLVTLNPETVNKNIDDKQIIKSIDYSHPVFDLAMIDAQTKWSSISGNGLHTHFCGAYWFNGFHEDGVRSGLRVCQALGHDIEIKDDVDPTHLPDADRAHTPFRYKDMPVKADTKLRKLNKREVITATTNQELVEYAERLQSTVIDGGQKKKRGLFGYRNPK